MLLDWNWKRDHILSIKSVKSELLLLQTILYTFFRSFKSMPNTTCVVSKPCMMQSTGNMFELGGMPPPSHGVYLKIILPAD